MKNKISKIVFVISAVVAPLVFSLFSHEVSLKDFESYGEPIKQKEDFDSLWNSMVHEFDWKILGPTRQRFLSSDGSYYWVQRYTPPLQDIVKRSKAMESWKKLVLLGKKDPIAFSTKLLAIHERLHKDEGLYNESCLIPFILNDLNPEVRVDEIKEYGTAFLKAKVER